ncbi:UNVERIFIED_CONTAM: putative mitochondrial protein [Sesamum calycinum]|uniref:Mitochondrial protein n=1 Tax=Sesamum calycinum TaxID=2727403 RepID=A0AAW2KR06_9LAMI
MYDVVCKLKNLKTEFRRQKKLTGDLSNNVTKAKFFLDKAQALFDNHKEDIFLTLVKCCRQVYSTAIKLEISMLQQRAKLRWLKHGDQNSKVFFRKINSTRVKQRVFQITTASGDILTDQHDVTQEFVTYFQNLLGGSSSHRVLDLGFLRHDLKHSITTSEANLLVAPVTHLEVKEAFFNIDIESAPGPDGYTSAFYRNAWPVVGQSIVEAVGDFFRTGKILKQINTTLLVLIPKVNMPTYVSDFRPISCCNVLYKAITKILVKRLQQVLPLLIDYSQNAFVPGRSISDNILLAQELLAGYNQTRLPARCTLKIDIQKAYDSVEWDFLLEVLRLFNFPQQFIMLIEQCISTASFSVSLNGSIYGFFKGGRGLRQGDPISPYLFVLVMEIWNTLLRRRVQNAPQFQHHWKCKELGLVTLCFADDVLLFCKAHIPSIKVLTDALSEFATLSGLKVNPAKSQTILSRAVQQERQQILATVGFQEGSLPVKYLGIPLTSSRLTISDCRPLIDKVDIRLAGWQHQNLSYAGRLQLIKSVLSTLHTYWASVFILPKGVLKLLEKKMRAFLWQGSSGRGNAKVAWDQLCKPKEEGGLGIRTIPASTHNNLDIQSRSRFVGWKKMLKLRPILQRGVTYKVGDGSSFSLWQDIWHIRGPLCLNFPRGPEVTGLPLHSTLSSVLQHNHWTWPASTDSDITEIMSQLPPTFPSAADRICWNSTSGSFTIETAILLIQPSATRVHWHGLLQGKFKIARHGFILWLAILEKLSTMDKPWVPGEANCVLCGEHCNETHDHLFFNCWYSRRCLAILKTRIKFQWPHLEWQRGITWASKKWRGNHLVNAALRATLAALVYRIWEERNNRKFIATASSAEITSNKVLEDVRMRILSSDLSPSLQTINLYRIWNLHGQSGNRNFV